MFTPCLKNYLHHIGRNVSIITELQKDYFCPVSWFSTEKCPNQVYNDIFPNIKHKSKYRLVLCSFMVIWSWIVPLINTILSFFFLLPSLVQKRFLDQNLFTLIFLGTQFFNTKFFGSIMFWSRFFLTEFFLTKTTTILMGFQSTGVNFDLLELSLTMEKFVSSVFSSAAC